MHHVVSYDLPYQGYSKGWEIGQLGTPQKKRAVCLTLLDLFSKA
jgi:hypothetical protein